MSEDFTNYQEYKGYQILVAYPPTGPVYAVATLTGRFTSAQNARVAIDIHIANTAIENPPVYAPESIKLYESYHGVDIYQGLKSLQFYVTINNNRYGPFGDVQTARNLVDQLKPETVTVTKEHTYHKYETYKGTWDIYQYDDDLKYFFFYNNAPTTGEPEIETVYAQIDTLIAASQTQSEPTTITTTTTGTVTVTGTVVSGLPWYVAWIKPVLDWITALYNSVVDGVLVPLQSSFSDIQGKLGALNKAVSDSGLQQVAANTILSGMGDNIGDSVIGGLKGFSDGLQTPLNSIGADTVKTLTSAMAPHSPDPEIKAAVEEMLKQIQASQEEIIKRIHSSPDDPSKAPETAALLAAQLLTASVGVSVAGALIDLLHPIKGIGALEIAKGVVEEIGMPRVIADLISAPAEVGIVPSLTKYYNALYQPMIPGYTDLINMRVKEKIEQPEFEQLLKYQGYSEYFSGKIWDAHFQAPNLNDILVAWRRGKIDEKRVDELMTLIDLDPFYKDIFDTRKHEDPSLSLTRYLFETGAIPASEVPTYIHRLGFRPEDEANIIDFVIKSQERRFRMRYVTALSTGYARGVVTPEELTKSVTDAGYSTGSATWIMKAADIRKDLAARVGNKPRLVSVGELKQLYENDKITEDALRNELVFRLYPTDQVELLIDSLNLTKSTEVQGKKKLALSVTDLIKAWKNEVVTEDYLRIQLTLRGLPTDQQDILINTNKPKTVV